MNITTTYNHIIHFIKQQKRTGAYITYGLLVTIFFFLKWQLFACIMIYIAIRYAWQQNIQTGALEALTILLLVAVSWSLVTYKQVQTAAQAGGSLSSHFSLEDTKTLPTETSALVIRVIDGDSIIVRYDDGSQQEIRYIGVDTPEIVPPNEMLQCMGGDAARFNASLVLGKRVRLVREVSNTDTMGRFLRHVYLPDGRLVGDILVEQGYARALAFAPDTQLADHFQTLEIQAAQGGIGVWGAHCFK